MILTRFTSKFAHSVASTGALVARIFSLLWPRWSSWRRPGENNDYSSMLEKLSRTLRISDRPVYVGLDWSRDENRKLKAIKIVERSAWTARDICRYEKEKGSWSAWPKVQRWLRQRKFSITIRRKRCLLRTCHRWLLYSFTEYCSFFKVYYLRIQNPTIVLMIR